jgi:hypothetical protein
VQKELFIHKEHFYYNPLSYLSKNVIGNQSITHYTADGEIANYMLFSVRLPAGARVQVSPKPDYTLDIENVAPIVHEADAPPEQSRVYSVRFYYSPYLSGDVFWADESKRWAKNVDHAAEPTNDLKAAAAQITAGAATDEEKARKLYDAVQALDNTAFSRQRSESERAQMGLSRGSRDADQVWMEKSGTPNEIATLYLALARAAGLQASGMSVTDRSRRIFDPGFLSLDQLTVDLVVLHIGGKDIFVDPGEKLLPFGHLYWSHALSGGLLETGDSATHEAVTPPDAAKDAINAQTADLTLDAKGGVSGTVKVLRTGPEALRWRQLNLTAGETEVEKQFSESLPGLLPQGIAGELEHIDGLNTSAGFLTFTVKVTGQLGQATGKRLVVPGFFFSTGAHVQFVAEQKREAPIDLHYADQEINAVMYHLPVGFSVESAPQPVQLPWPGHAALVVQTQSGAGVITIKHILARAFVVLAPAEYPALRDFSQKVATNDQQSLVLAQGN